MKKVKTFVFLLFIFLLISPIYGAQNHISVPLGHRVYSILRIAEIRGVLDSVMEVRPFTTSKVLTYLNTLKDSNKLSNSEREIVNELITEFTTIQPDNSFKSLATYGSYSTYSEKMDVNTTMGFKGSYSYRQSLNALSLFDSRNLLQGYIRGDIKEVASFNMNIGLTYDHLDYNLFLKNDFKVPVKGKYEVFWDIYDGDHNFFVGFFATPEISISLLKNKLNIKWASIERDWGVGDNNLMISKDGNSINGVELNYEVTSWLRYAFFTGALGKFTAAGSFIKSGTDGNFYKTYLPSDNLHQEAYNNNFSAHRVEVSLPFNIKFGVFESVVYRKRFELAYLNPLSILMFEQDIMGDFDNMLAGIDLNYTLKNYFRTYFSFATTEMNEIKPSKFITAPRNVFSIQIGIDINIPFISFSSATVQYTYLSPFFYTHYPELDNNGVVIEEIPMVNAGRNIGYPLRPNSDEFLVKLNLNFKNNWDGNLTFKYQRRSGQYGFDIGKWMAYEAAKQNKYEAKSFNQNVFEKNIGIEATVNKKLNNYPIQFTVSYLLLLNNERKVLPDRVWDGNDETGYIEANHKNYDKFPVIKYVVKGPWKGWSIMNSIKIGANIWI